MRALLGMKPLQGTGAQLALTLTLSLTRTLTLTLTLTRTLASNPHPNPKKESFDLHLRKTLEERAVTMGNKLSALEKYNAQLVKVINDLRCAILPHRQETKPHA